MSSAPQSACITLAFSPEIARGLERLIVSQPEAPRALLIAAVAALLSRYAAGGRANAFAPRARRHPSTGAGPSRRRPGLP